MHSEGFPGLSDFPTNPGPAPAPAKKGTRLRCIALGAVTSLVVLSFLYGPNNAFGAVFLLTVCTAGIGLIPMLFGSWLVGWVMLSVWTAIRSGEDQGPTVPLDAPGG
jgi:hypothetical protein